MDEVKPQKGILLYIVNTEYFLNKKIAFTLDRVLIITLNIYYFDINNYLFYYYNDLVGKEEFNVCNFFYCLVSIVEEKCF